MSSDARVLRCCVHCRVHGPVPCPGHDAPCPECDPVEYIKTIIPIVQEVWPALSRKPAGKRTAIEQAGYAELCRTALERIGVPVQSVEIRVRLHVPGSLACFGCGSQIWNIDMDSLGALVCFGCGTHITGPALLAAARAAGKLPASEGSRETEGEHAGGG